ncbi:MAG: hypothetical protein GEU75_08365 [Dehalococcoidia bacterium]|nr:hypothetical protein [Dehalococcoidia bacterium]
MDGYYGPAISIGGVDLSAIDLTYGYSVLANNGRMVGQPVIGEREEDERELEPITILRIEDAKGEVLFDANEQRAEQQVVPAEHAYLVTSILSDPSSQCVTFGCGGISVPGRVAAVKTGTSEPFDPRGPGGGKIGETWAFGYTPDYSVGVWAGNSDNAPIVNIYSTSISFRVMRDTLQATYHGGASGAFARPDNIEERRVCGGGGSCRNEVFVKGSTPANAPPASSNAQAEPTAAPEPRITAAAAPPPSPIASVTGPTTAAAGTVSIQGWAWSNAMQYYRLEYGSGSSPLNWSALGQWSTPVQGGTLGVLPTSGWPPGTYSVRVVVQDQNQGEIISAAHTVLVP